jgi:hypothetical protein
MFITVSIVTYSQEKTNRSLVDLFIFAVIPLFHHFSEWKTRRILDEKENWILVVNSIADSFDSIVFILC